MNIDPSSFFTEIHLEEHIRDTHQAITAKFPINNTEFDAWYTNRQHVRKDSLKLGMRLHGKSERTADFSGGKTFLKSLGQPSERLQLCQNSGKMTRMAL